MGVNQSHIGVLDGEEHVCYGPGEGGRSVSLGSLKIGLSGSSSSAVVMARFMVSFGLLAMVWDIT